MRYALDVHIRNRARGEGRFEFPMTVERQDRLRGTDAGWTATVRHPENGFASLRVHATDPDGNTVKQTVMRAYAIGKPTGEGESASRSRFGDLLGRHVDPGIRPVRHAGDRSLDPVLDVRVLGRLPAGDHADGFALAP